MQCNLRREVGDGALQPPPVEGRSRVDLVGLHVVVPQHPGVRRQLLVPGSTKFCTPRFQWISNPWQPMTWRARDN